MTWYPRRASRLAAVDPAGPPPTTQISARASTSPSGARPRAGSSGPGPGVGGCKIVGAGSEQADVCLQAVVQPTAHIVTRGPAAMDHLVMTAAPAEVTGPARPA